MSTKDSVGTSTPLTFLTIRLASITHLSFKEEPMTLSFSSETITSGMMPFTWDELKVRPQEASTLSKIPIAIKKIFCATTRGNTNRSPPKATSILTTNPKCFYRSPTNDFRAKKFNDSKYLGGTPGTKINTGGIMGAVLAVI